MRIRDVVALAISALTIAVGGLAVATAAIALPAPGTGANGLLSLDSDSYPAENLTIARGERVLWPVTAELDASTAGQLTVRVESDQPLAAVLRFEFATCDVPWILPADPMDPAACAAGEEIIIPEVAFAATDAATSWSLGEILPGEPRFFLITLALPLATPGSLAAEPAQVAFGFAARDQDVPALLVATGGLAVTGGLAAGPLLLAAGLLLGGLTLARVRASGAPV